MNFFNKLTTTTAIVTLFLAAAPTVHAMDSGDIAWNAIEWNAAKSMTAALPHTINVTYADSEKELVGKNGPSPANFALTVMLTPEEPHVLMCPDYDLRPLKDSNLRPTYGALKASFGFGLSKDHKFENSRDALIKGPANISLYKLFDTIPAENVQTIQFAYSEGGEEWGPAVTIPLVLTGHNSKKIELAEANQIVDGLNQKAKAAFEDKKEDDLMTGRFRDFTLVPLSKLLPTGSDQPAVLDENKLEVIEHNGVTCKLWDEPQMRKNLLPHIAAVTAKIVDMLFSDRTKEYTITLAQLLEHSTEDFSVKWEVGNFSVGNRTLALSFYNDNNSYLQKPILKIFSDNTPVKFKPTEPVRTSYQPNFAFRAYLKSDYYNLGITVGN